MATPPSSSWAEGEVCLHFGKNWEKLLCAVLLTCAFRRHLEFITEDLICSQLCWIKGARFAGNLVSGMTSQDLQ